MPFNSSTDFMRHGMKQNISILPMRSNSTTLHSTFSSLNKSLTYKDTDANNYVNYQLVTYSLNTKDTNITRTKLHYWQKSRLKGPFSQNTEILYIHHLKHRFVLVKLFNPVVVSWSPVCDSRLRNTEISHKKSNDQSWNLRETRAALLTGCVPNWQCVLYLTSSIN